ncbi:histidine phosphatase family protein [Micromonospora sp. ALFpr18c]|uniref:histidine phosphatase family protein n=1 Tax=unclassified Micromonospora TaxID=2617518 RepID=UPI00124B2119|nr:MULTISPECIES: histidine phosphatase family protein [unclassified Micromonospora]KAB1948747.1 histidine phosphatase family protein [Micromonospora sp. ALFpr18c]MDG4758487.1 histidine phosphatase family protein [Micromonospora sp. WMMD710]
MTATSLRLVAHGHTAALRRARFGGTDDGLDEGGLRAVLALACAPEGRWGHLGAADVGLSSPAAAAVQTADALGLTPTVEAALTDCDYGHWTGRSLDDVAADQPQALHEWLSTPDAAPHGGESVTAVRDRVGHWLDGQRGRGRRVVAVTHPLVIRVAVVHALGLPTATYRQVDVEPLAVVRLTDHGARWQLRLAAPATPRMSA